MLNQETAIAYVRDRLMIDRASIWYAVPMQLDDVPAYDVCFDNEHVGFGVMTVWTLSDGSLYGEW